MLTVDVMIEPKVDFTQIEPVVEEVCRANQLQITLKTTLAGYPGSIHWHLKQGRKRGALELTVWPQQRRLWFKVQSGRTGVWIDEAIDRLKPQLEEALKPLCIPDKKPSKSGIRP